MSIEIDPGIDEALLENAEQARARWDARRTARTARSEALAADRPLEADTPARLAARVNMLVEEVRLSSRGRRPPGNPTLKMLVERPMPVTAEEVNASIVEEVVLGARDFLSVEFFEKGLLASRSVGRVLIDSGRGLMARGTGFLVAPGLLLTNRHVLTSPELAAQCSVEMDYEQNRFGPLRQSQIFSLEPDRFFLNNKDLDYALVAVAPLSERGGHIASYGWLPLIAAQGKIAVLDLDHVNIIQHPLGREKEVVVRNNHVLDLRTANDNAAEDIGPYLHYEADTEKGSSGSPVLNDQWDVVALHHSGVPAKDDQGNWLDKDEKIWRRGEQPIERLKWVANEAIRVSSLLASVSIAPVKANEQELLRRLLSAQPPARLGDKTEREEALDPAAAVPATARVPRRRVEGGASSVDAPVEARPAAVRTTATLELPSRITFSIGDVAAAAPPRVTVSSGERAILEEALEPEDFADRDGYNRAFLGETLPLPTIVAEPRFGGALRVPRPAREGDTEELRYHHYSVIMCSGRRLAYVSACNVDFGAAENADRDQGTNSWRNDPRIDRGHQLSRRFYDHNDYDKGHLTRRDDAAWGQSLAEAIAANNDTFFYTNAAPQHYLFNQSDEFTHAGLDLWGDLENHIAQQGGLQKVTIFNGPVFGENDKGLHDALVPLSFYKIVAWRDGDVPGAVGFLLHQDDLVASLPEEAIDAGRFEIRQRRIADIEELLDLRFGPLKQWDRSGGGEQEEALGDDGILIRSLDDVRVEPAPTARTASRASGRRKNRKG